MIARDNQTYYWCPHYSRMQYGYANGLCISLYAADEYDKWIKNKKNLIICICNKSCKTLFYFLLNYIDIVRV